MAAKTIDRLTKVDYLINQKKTGTPGELAKKLRVSERCARQYVNMLRELGAPIAYCRKNATYFYKEQGYFLFRFTKTLTEQE